MVQSGCVEFRCTHDRLGAGFTTIINPSETVKVEEGPLLESDARKRYAGSMQLPLAPSQSTLCACRNHQIQGV